MTWSLDDAARRDRLRAAGELPLLRYDSVKPRLRRLRSRGSSTNNPFARQGDKHGRPTSRSSQRPSKDFPGRYETILGERGINLSGGQKQRASLARALARRPHIVLLDDALSAVDTHTEAEILRALREALAGRTALIASHRISAIRDASWIIVLDEGRIVEQGGTTI